MTAIRLSRVRATVTAIVIAVGVLIVSAPTASTSATYVNAVPGGDAQVRPKTIAVGNGLCSPYFRKLQWRSWGRRVAKAHGIVEFAMPDLSKGESCGSVPLQRRSVTVFLGQRQTCDGRRFYRVLRSSGSSRRFNLDCSRSQER